VTAPLRRRVEVLECQAVVTDTVAILVGTPSDAEVEGLYDAGVQTIFRLPDNGRGPGAEQWQRSRPE
jgi:hypothetical protein